MALAFYRNFWESSLLIEDLLIQSLEKSPPKIDLRQELKFEECLFSKICLTGVMIVFVIFVHNFLWESDVG